MKNKNYSTVLPEKHVEYLVPLNITQCCLRLETKNIYDLFKYKISHMSKEGCIIVFKRALSHMCGSIGTTYSIQFVSMSEQTTKIVLDFIRESGVSPIPMIPIEWVHEFFEKKMDAQIISSS